MESEVEKLAVAESRLRELIRTIVKRRVSSDMPLSWRLMFEIENEAISSLLQDADVDIRYINLMVSPSAQRSSGTEEPVSLTNVYAMHTALWMIQEAYYHARRSCKA